MNTATKGLWAGMKSVPLKGISVSGSISAAMSEITLEQTYANEESVAIEAVYSFPIPMNAVLLDVTIQIDDRQLTGTVTAKNDAEASYEAAIEDGDTAMIVRKVSDGVYSVSLGNLQPGERAAISYRFVMLNHWNGKEMRFSLPTVISDRFGDPLDSGYDIHERPWTDLSATHPFQLALTLDETLSGCAMESPTHAIASFTEGEKRGLRLSSEVAFLDRDFVLRFTDAANEGFVSLVSHKDPYADQYVTQLAIKRELKGLVEATEPISVKIVVDCSGSMAGDSIVQARKALQSIIQSLGDDDEFALIKFGSNSESLSDEMLSVSPRNIAQAEQYILRIDANMGGTEIGDALSRAYRIKGHAGRRQSVLLITDGAVWGEDRVLERAQRAEHCIYTVGVGSAVSEQLVRGLAEQTGGQCAFVTPNESMSEVIVSQFKRMRQPAVEIDVDFESEVEAVRTASPSLLDGESSNLFFVSKEPVCGHARVRLHRLDNAAEEVIPEVPCVETQSSIDARSRLCASLALTEMDEEDQQAHAVQYQLFTDKTAMTIVDVREVKAQGIPELRVVPQMAAAGHMGFGSVSESHKVVKRLPSRFVEVCESVDFSYSASKMDTSDMEFLDIPAFLKRQNSEFEKPSDIQTLDADAFIEWLNSRVSIRGGRMREYQIPTLTELSAWLPNDVIKRLRSLARNVHRDVIVACFVKALLSIFNGAGLNRTVARALKAKANELGPNGISGEFDRLAASITIA